MFNEVIEGPASVVAAGKVAGETVLVVDDQPIDRHIARSIVESIPGLNVLDAADGDEALLAIADTRPAVVLTDVQMPGLDGYGLVEAIRGIDPEIPVILMTAYGSEDVAMLALRAGAASYVPKRSLANLLPSTLLRILSLAVAGRRRRQLMGAMRARTSAFRLENDAQLIAPLVELLQEDLAGMDLCDGTARMRVGVALHEAISNALYHGNLEVASDLRQEEERHFYEEADRRRVREPYRSRFVHIEARLDRESATYVIRDEGPGFDTSTLGRPIDPEDLMRVGGRGLLLIRTFMDEVVYNAAGNEVTLVTRRQVDDRWPFVESLPG